MIILKTHKLSKSFGGMNVINELDFEVEEGDIFGIAGPNGAGKTTLFNLITGFYRGSGDIYFENKSINGLKPYQICKKGITRTFQTPELFVSLNAYENVSVGSYFGALIRNNIRDEVLNAMALVGLEEKIDTPANRLNLYEKKMVMLAAALATKPKLLLLDEPVGGLSQNEINKSVEIFKKINNQLGLTIIIIEHLMSVLAEICKNLMIIHNGEKICVSSPLEVSTNKRVIELYLGGQIHACS